MASNSRWSWPPSTETSIALARIGATSTRRSRRSTITAERVLDVAVVEDLDHPLHRVAGDTGGPGGVGRVGDPPPDALADVHAGEALGQHLAGEEVPLDELAEAAPDLVLALAG